MKMPLKDLRTEIRGSEMNVHKMRMGITMGKEKDTARYRSARKDLARMQTALTSKMKEEPLKSASPAARIAAPRTAKVSPPKAKKSVSTSK